MLGPIDFFILPIDESEMIMVACREERLML